ncbi:MAG TPA: energy transducer TonB [Stenotrophomonas sp.]|jgi:protein TonB
MVTTSTHGPDYHETRDATPPRERERGASAWLWALLILALVALPAWWWIRNSEEPTASTMTTAPVSDGTLPAQTLPEPATQRPATMVRKTAPRATAIRDHDARPLANNPTPAYPRTALRAGVEGSVTARIQVDAQGRVSDAQIVERTGERNRELDRAVLNTVRDWRFEPATRDGHAVASVVNVPVDFRTAQQ